MTATRYIIYSVSKDGAGYDATGPLTHHEIVEFRFSMIAGGFIPICWEISDDAPPTYTRAEFIAKARQRLDSGAHVLSPDGASPKTVLDAYEARTGHPQPQAATDKVEPFWFDKPGVKINTKAAWAAVVSVSKGA